MHGTIVEDSNTLVCGEAYRHLRWIARLGIPKGPRGGISGILFWNVNHVDLAWLGPRASRVPGLETSAFGSGSGHEFITAVKFGIRVCIVYYLGT